MAEKGVARETWSGKLDFLLSCIGYAVGLGNVWRFPYLCYRNGGGAFLVPYVIMLLISGLPIFFCCRSVLGAFLVPYVIMLLISGLPIFFFELALGQFASEGPITVWKVNPLFYGIGWGMVTISGMVSIYYNVIIMWSIYYMFISFVNLDGEVPWKYCHNSWNTDDCRYDPYPDFPSLNATEQVDEYAKMLHLDCVYDLSNSSFGNASMYDLNYTTLATNFTGCERKLVSPSEEYFNRFVLRLHEADSISDIGGVSLKNVICLLFAWILIFFCLIKGIKSSGKVVYFTATFPYVILVVLLIRGLTLPGFRDGIEFYIIPKWEELKNPKVWSDAATQIFYSLGPGFGGLLTMASFNNFKNNCWRDSVIVAFINCGTSVFAGFAIFSLLGFMAHQTNQPVDKVATDGPGLAFVAYPEGLARLPVSSLWAFLFFFMLLTLGLDSQFVMMETVISGITDVWPTILRKKKALFTFTCCIIGFVLGIPMSTKGGMLVLTLFDWYSGSYNLMLVAFSELIAVCWIYGIRNYIRDIEMMIGKHNKLFWSYYVLMWCVVTPIAIVFIVIMSAIKYVPAGYSGVEFPPWAEGVGWIMAVLPLLFIFIGIIFQCVKQGCNAKRCVTPREDWGPRLASDRVGRYNDNLGYVPDDEDDIPIKVYHTDHDMSPPDYPQVNKL